MNEKWIFTSINGGLAEKQLLLSLYGEYEVKVLGNSLPAQHAFFEGVPFDLREENDFYCLMNQFGRWKLCAANEIVENVFDDTIIAIRAFVCNLTQTLRSKHCELLVNGTGPIRCKECKMLLNRIRRLKYSRPRLTSEKEEKSEQELVEVNGELVEEEITSHEAICQSTNQFQEDPSNVMNVDEEAEEADPPVDASDFLCMNMVEYGSFA